MRALVWHGAGDLRLEDRPLPALDPRRVRVRVEACGICGSDLEEYLHGPVAVPADRAGAGGLVLGHEFAGVVARVGAAAHGLTDTPAPGDRVGVHTLVPCRRCPWCRRGDHAVCPQQEIVGLTLDGGLAEYVDVAPGQLVPVPAALDLALAALAEPLAVAVRAVDRAEPEPGQDAVVVGAGTIGLLAGWLLQREGTRVAMVDRDPRREAAAHALGLGFRGDLPAPTDRALWLDCTGSPDVLGRLVDRAPPHSRIVVLGVAVPPAGVSLYPLLAKELTVLGSVSHERGQYAAALDLLAGHPLLGSLVGAHWTLADAADGLAGLAAGRRTGVKVLVRPGWNGGHPGDGRKETNA